VPDDAVANMIDALKLFGIGSSWGGFESPLHSRKPDEWTNDYEMECLRAADSAAHPAEKFRRHDSLI
jgi:hypothetical protein